MSHHDKSPENYVIALFAYERKKCNAAVDRLYCAIYQAFVGELQGRGKTAEDFVSGLELDRPGYKFLGVMPYSIDEAKDGFPEIREEIQKERQKDMAVTA